MVEDRDEERLRLARPSACRDECRFGRTVQGGQPSEGPRLVIIRRRKVGRVPPELLSPAVAGHTERQPHSKVRPSEDAVLRVVDERGERIPDGGIYQVEGGREVLRERAPQAVGGQGRPHDDGPQPASAAACNCAENTACACRYSPSRSAL